MQKDTYESPFCSRYAGKDMQKIFSADMKFKTWRRLWLALARSEMKLGLPITEQQLLQMEENVDNINYDVAQQKEKEIRHDVMAHIYAYGEQCPLARGIIHLGATSCYVGDNTDIILMKQALLLIKKKLLNVIANLSKFAMQYQSLPCLAYTHLQPAQLTTVGKRATLWIHDLWLDYQQLLFQIDNLAMLGSKGTTGTQASFLDLFEGDQQKVEKLDKMIAQEMGFEKTVAVSGQTYSRKFDYFVLTVLSGIAQSSMKFSNDMRILQSFKEIEEPFAKAQVGSSAMPYKRNPMRCERITALSRYVMVDCLNPAFTAGTQWFERTLDDSANKRISVAEAFLGVDAILNIYANVTDGLVVYPKVIHQRVDKELPFMATENIMMEAVKRGGDRQQLHESLRKHSLAAAKVVKEQGGENDLLERISADPIFRLNHEDLKQILKPEHFIGRSAEQVDAFLQKAIYPLLQENESLLEGKIELSV